MDAIFERHSVRSFSDRPVSDEDIRRIVSAGCAAPSSKNDQPWKIVIVRQPRLSAMAYEFYRIAADLPSDRRGTVAETFSIMGSAPVCIFVFLEKNSRSRRFLAHVQSVGAFIENMAIEAQSLGLGSLWCGDILEVDEEAAEILGTSIAPVAALLIGYEKGESRRKVHKVPEDLIIEGYDEWGSR